jgi:hypothetical protein
MTYSCHLMTLAELALSCFGRSLADARNCKARTAASLAFHIEQMESV